MLLVLQGLQLVLVGHVLLAGQLAPGIRGRLDKIFSV